MAKLLTDQELQDMRDGRWSVYGQVSTLFVGGLLDHIEAQEEALVQARHERDEVQEQLSLVYQTWISEQAQADLANCQEVRQAQAEAAALRAEAQRLCHQVHSRAGDVCSLNCPQQSCFSTTAGQALLDELRRLRAVAEVAAMMWEHFECRHCHGVNQSRVRDALLAADYLKESV